MKLRFKPSPKLAFIAYFSYLLVFYGIWIFNGIQYQHIGDTADTLLKWYVLPLAGGSIVLLLLTTLFGWWKPALFETKEQLLKDKKILIAPIIMIAVSLIGLATKDFTNTTTLMWVYLIVGSLLVGFNEELVTRGILLSGFRSRYGEKRSWLLSTTFFSLIHLPNGFFGLGLGVAFQLVFTFIHGTAFYFLRRYTGMLIAAMLLHALWDFASFAGQADSGFPAQGLASFPLIIIVLITLWHVFKKQKQTNT